MSCPPTEARALLRCEPPFGALKLCGFEVNFTDFEVDENTFFLTFVADLQLHGLDELNLYSAPIPGRAAWEALVDAAISVRLARLAVTTTMLVPWHVHGLVRLLREGSIYVLSLGCFEDGEMFDAETVPVISAALRANSMLTFLNLVHCGVLNRPAGIDFFVGALVGHPTLKSISLVNNVVDDAEMRILASEALGRLVAAHSCALSHLDVSNCALGDDGLRPLFAALPLNTHISRLKAACNGVSATFAQVVLASVGANRSLTSLVINGRRQSENDPGDGEVSLAGLQEAEALVARRGGGRLS